MTRGTTPEIICKVTGIELSNVANMIITLRQGKLEIDKSSGEVLVTDQDVHVMLTQEESLEFSSGKSYQIQMRGTTNDGEVFASNIRHLPVHPILKDGEI